MADAQKACDKDSAIMTAWRAWRDSDDGKNTLAWAGRSNDGNLWAAFLAAWIAAGGEKP